jgi:hypothetical protein
MSICNSTQLAYPILLFSPLTPSFIILSSVFFIVRPFGLARSGILRFITSTLKFNLCIIQKRYQLVYTHTYKKYFCTTQQNQFSMLTFLAFEDAPIYSIWSCATCNGELVSQTSCGIFMLSTYIA